MAAHNKLEGCMLVHNKPVVNTSSSAVGSRLVPGTAVGSLKYGRFS